MALNYVWMSFFVIGILASFAQVFLTGDTTVLDKVLNGLFKMSGTAVELSIDLIGVMSFFLGLMKIAELSGLVDRLARFVSPFFAILFPDVPINHPAMGHIMMNLSANLLGLDNAATPFGLKAMASLQELNPHPNRASDAQIMLTVLLSSGLTLIPVGVIAQRAAMKAANPTDVFLPIFFATTIATVVAIVLVAIRQKIRLLQAKLLIGLGSLITVCAGLVITAATLSATVLEKWASGIGNGLILMIIVIFLIHATLKKVAVFDGFIQGAKTGFEMAVRVIPYLVAMLTAISVLRNSGVIDSVEVALRWLVSGLGMDNQFVGALPTALMKPLSGSGARALMIEAMQIHGLDSFVARLSAVFQGATDTTFYILALYFGSVGVRNTRYALSAALLADLAGVIAAIFIATLFFGNA